MSRKVIDYVLKEDVNSLDYIVYLIKRIIRNTSIKILVVDDSPSVRKHIRELLVVHRYQVFTAEDGKQADAIIEEHPDIKMVVTDYNMPNKDGFELCKEIRQKYNKDELAIIGMSSRKGSTKISVRFLKNGANDFIVLPFQPEEFYCRITQNIEFIEYIREIKEVSDKDYLTGLFNRRYFFEIGNKMFEDMKQAGQQLVAAIIGIDYLKIVNDEFGLEAGDMVIKSVSGTVQKFFQKYGLVSRLGGDEFVVLMPNTDHECMSAFEETRKEIESSNLKYNDNELSVTVSIGVCDNAESLEKMLQYADRMLRQAKDERNTILHFKA